MRLQTSRGQTAVVRAIVALMLTALIAGACGGDDGDGSAGGGGGDGDGTTIVIAIADEPSTLDPQAAEDGNERAVTDNIYETLLRRDTDTNDLVPLLATELPTQIDDETWEFKLREGVSFTNGEAFNADSVVYSVERVVDPDYSSAQRDFYGGLNGAEKIDDYTVHITTDGFDPALPARMYRLKMLPPVAGPDTDFVQVAIGTGPYKLVEWRRGQQVTLEANPDYWGDAPSITNATIRFIPAAGTRVAGLSTGEIHLSTLLPPEQANDAPKVLSREGLEFPVYRFKNYEGILEDPRVRLAMNYAVDKEAIADELFSGFATVASCQALTPGHFGYNPDLDPYPYDPDRARELLEEAGYAGESLEFLGATGRWLKDSEVHDAVLGYLMDVGMNFETDIRPFSSYLDRFLLGVGDNQPDVGFVSSSNALFDASNLDAYYTSDGSLSSYVNDEVDAAMNAARVETDTDQREAYFHEALQIGCEEDPVFLFLVNLQDIYGAAADLEWTPPLDASLYIAEMSLS